MRSLNPKVRHVVFNASSPYASGKSLNDVLHVGPVIQTDLILIILKWCMFKLGFNTHIEKMYRQNYIEPCQQWFQRILICYSPLDRLQDYEFNTVTFGVNCGPYLAIRSLLHV